MPDPTLSEAIKEAYASSPSDVVILHTLEFRHPLFLDENNKPMAIRLVRDHQNLVATLEENAPLNAGEQVTFIAMAFDLALPAIDTAPVPEITVTLDNVSGKLVPYLDKAVDSGQRIEITYRPYLSNDTSCPHMVPPITLTLSDVEADVMRITGRARLLDVGNKRFPGENYNAKSFPGLAH